MSLANPPLCGFLLRLRHEPFDNSHVQYVRAIESHFEARQQPQRSCGRWPRQNIRRFMSPFDAPVQLSSPDRSISMAMAGHTESIQRYFPGIRLGHRFRSTFQAFFLSTCEYLIDLCTSEISWTAVTSRFYDAESWKSSHDSNNDSSFFQISGGVAGTMWPFFCEICIACKDPQCFPAYYIIYCYIFNAISYFIHIQDVLPTHPVFCNFPSSFRLRRPYILHYLAKE